MTPAQRMGGKAERGGQPLRRGVDPVGHHKRKGVPMGHYGTQRIIIPAMCAILVTMFVILPGLWLALFLILDSLVALWLAGVPR
jgi:hypothetical protein